MARPMLPKVSFLDPTVTYTVSPYQTACGAADMLSHIFEVYFNTSQDLYMLDCFMEGMIKTIIKYAPIAMKEPENYEARANLMWTSSWAINGFIDGGKQQAWSCHPIEHELSAIYDITHGLGLAILTPRWAEYCLDETTVSKYVQFGVNVFGIDAAKKPMDIAKESIRLLSEFLFDTLKLNRTFTEIGIQTGRFSHNGEESMWQQRHQRLQTSRRKRHSKNLQNVPIAHNHNIKCQKRRLNRRFLSFLHNFIMNIRFALANYSLLEVERLRNL